MMVVWKVNEHNNLCEKNKDTSKIKVKTKQRKVNGLYKLQMGKSKHQRGKKDNESRNSKHVTIIR